MKELVLFFLSHFALVSLFCDSAGVMCIQNRDRV